MPHINTELAELNRHTATLDKALAAIDRTLTEVDRGWYSDSMKDALTARRAEIARARARIDNAREILTTPVPYMPDEAALEAAISFSYLGAKMTRGKAVSL